MLSQRSRIRDSRAPITVIVHQLQTAASSNWHRSAEILAHLSLLLPPVHWQHIMLHNPVAAPASAHRQMTWCSPSGFSTRALDLFPFNYNKSHWPWSSKLHWPWGEVCAAGGGDKTTNTKFQQKNHSGTAHFSVVHSHFQEQPDGKKLCSLITHLFLLTCAV